jgi:hypothetical protein
MITKSFLIKVFDKRTVKAAIGVTVSMAMIFSMFTNVKAGSNNVYLEVDCSQEIGQRLHTESYNNITNNVESNGTPDNPGTADMLGQAGVKTKVARNFYTMGSWYTDKTKSITDPVNSDPSNPNLNLYTYGRDIGAHLSTMSDAILAVVKCGGASSPVVMGSGSSFNYNEYEEVLKKGLLAFKKNTPKLEYYECENEPEYALIHRGGTLELEEYLKHYERAARAVDWVNSQLTPADGQPLKIGGPVSAQYNKSYIAQFLDAVKANGYKLDFVAWHHYNEDASIVEKHVSELKAALSERGMNAVTVISEYGYMGGGTDYDPGNTTLAKQAAYMTDFVYHAEKSKIGMPMNWVSTHATALFKNQFLYEPQLSNGTDAFEEYTFDKPYTGRYIKLHGVSDNNSTGDKYFRVKDVKFFDENGNQIPVPITSATPQKVKDTTDGIDSTLFSTNSEFGAFIDYDLGSLKTVSKVQIAWGRKDANTPTPVYKFYMKISSDNATYTDLLGEEKYTPYFHTMLMESKLGDTLLKTTDMSLERTGVKVRATKNSDSKVTMIVWNYQDDYTNTYNVALNAKNLPTGFTGMNIRYKSYLVDSTNSNLKYNVPAGKVLGDDTLIMNNDTVIEGAGTASLNFSLAPNAVTLIELTPDTMPAAGTPKLSGVKINGQPINYFDPLVTNYSVAINSNAATATIEPVFDSNLVTAVPASANIPIPAAGTTTSHIITVTSKDGASSRNYTVFIRSGTDAGLKSVTLSIGLPPKIISGQYSYELVLPTGGESVQINSAVPTSYIYGATAVVTQQPDLANGQNTGKVLVTAENGNTQEYSFNFSVAGAPIHGTTLYSNDFEGGGTSVSDWTYNSDIFSVYSGSDSKTFSARPSNNNSNYVAYTRSIVASNYSYEAKVKATSSPSLPGLLARVSQDGKSFYMFRILPVEQKVGLTKAINGTLSSSLGINASYPLDLNKWYLLRMELNGSNIKCYVGNQLVLQGQDTSFTSGGIGFRAANGCFDADDIVVSNYLFTDLQDNFEDGNDTNPAWSKTNGTWSVITDASGNKVYNQANTSGEALASVGSKAWTDYTVEAKVKVAVEGVYPALSGIIGRYTDRNNFYWLQVDTAGNAVDLKKKVAGAMTTVQHVSGVKLNTNQWYTIRLQMQGSSIKGYIDGVERINVSDTSFTAGSAGLRMFNDAAGFDDFTVVCGVKDNFEDGNDTTYPAWGKNNGTWSVVTDTTRPSGQQKVYKQSSTSGEALAYFGQSTWMDYSFEAKINLTAEGAVPALAGIVGRYTDANNFYWLSFDAAGNAIALKKKVAGTITTVQYISNVQVNPEEWNTLRLEMYGSTIKGYLNGVEKISVVDSSLTTGKAGIRFYNAAGSADNVIVK